MEGGSEAGPHSEICLCVYLPFCAIPTFQHRKFTFVSLLASIILQRCSRSPSVLGAPTHPSTRFVLCLSFLAHPSYVTFLFFNAVHYTTYPRKLSTNLLAHVLFRFLCSPNLAAAAAAAASTVVVIVVVAVAMQKLKGEVKSLQDDSLRASTQMQRLEEMLEAQSQQAQSQAQAESQASSQRDATLAETKRTLTQLEKQVVGI